MITIEHTKRFVGPFIGYYSNGKIRVLATLTKAERSFVVAHEYYHSQDNSANWMVREAKATLMPLLGFVMVVFRTLLNPVRLFKYFRQKGSK